MRREPKSAEYGQSLWQMLPLGPTGYGNSPYMCFSAFAGNPLLISLERLVNEQLLDPADIRRPPSFAEERVDYAKTYEFKRPLLIKAFQRFHYQAGQGYPSDYYAFCEQNAFWLEDYALFVALKHTNKGGIWEDWDESSAKRAPDALVEWRNKLADEIFFRKYMQYLFFKQWTSLRSYCHQKGIRVIGDVPIYVAYDSSDVWANGHLFHLDEHGRPLVVAGVPPDYFGATGQR